MKKAYLSLLKYEKDSDKIKSLLHAVRGRPLLLRGYDKDVAGYVKVYEKLEGLSIVQMS